MGLLLKYPILCVPYCCAALLVSCLVWFQYLATKRIVYWLPSTQSIHSALGGSVHSPIDVSVTLLWMARLRSSIRWARYYADSCIYTIGTVLTAILVGMILRGDKPAFAHAWTELQSSLKRILFYALKSWFLTLVLFVAVLLTENRLRNLVPPGSRIDSAITATVDLLNVLCFAWIMAPILVQLLRTAGSPTISDACRRLGRYAFLITVAASFAFRRLLNPLLTKLSFDFRDHQYAISGLVTLVIDSPYVLLYIALALLSEETSLEIEDMEISHRRKLLAAFMPLHFREKEEP